MLDLDTLLLPVDDLGYKYYAHIKIQYLHEIHFLEMKNRYVFEFFQLILVDFSHTFFYIYYELLQNLLDNQKFPLIQVLDLYLLV